MTVILGRSSIQPDATGTEVREDTPQREVKAPSFIVSSTSQVSSIIEAVYTDILLAVIALGYAEPQDVAISIIKNGTSLAIHASEAERSIRPIETHRKIGFNADRT